MSWLINIFTVFLNPFREWWRRRVAKQFLKCTENGVAEKFLGLTLKLMSLTFKLDKGFRKNIDGFKGRYQFKSFDNSITIAAIFTGKGLKVRRKLIPDPDVSVAFKDGRSIMRYLLSRDRDILKLVLNHEVVLKGNTNYMLKFGYMANHLQLALTRKLP
jgi:hypothetical protein